MKLTTATLFTWATATQIVLGADRDAEPSCKCYLGDDCWPTQRDWNALTEATEGRFAAELPPGLACYRSYEDGIVPGLRDPAVCEDVEKSWNDSEWV